MIHDYIALAFKNLRERRLRAWLTMLGIFIGIATIVALIGLGQGLEDAVFSQFSVLTPDLITISGSGSSAMEGSFSELSVPLTDKELEAVESVSGIDAVAYRSLQATTFEYDELNLGVMIVTIPDGKYRDNMYSFAGIKLEKGKLIEDSDKYDIILGYNVAHDDKYKKDIQIGDKITLKGKEFNVKGILEKKGSFMLDGAAYINKMTAVELFEDVKKEEYGLILARIKRDTDMKVAVENIEKKLRKVRNVKVDEENFTVTAALDNLKQMQSSLFGVQLFIYLIAGISIVVGGIGITNTMFTSVLERTKQIGIMKSIGARNSTIFTLFFIESGLLGLIGGLIGISLGYLLGKGIESLAAIALKSDLIQASFSPTLIIGSLSFAFIIGAMSGLWPAMRAAKMHPVEALRETH